MISCAAPRRAGGGLSKETRPGAVQAVAAGERRRGFLGADPTFGAGAWREVPPGRRRGLRDRLCWA